ncbi:MAG: pinensin family lanthipeptide [Bacteroidota bacterium]
MKKNKLSLSNVKVSSFVTSLEAESQSHLRGGAPVTYACQVVTFKLDCILHTKPVICTL